MSFTSLNFEFANRKSSEFPLYIVQLDSGMYATEIGGEKSIKSNKIAYRDDIIYYGTDLNTLKFSITVCPLDNYWTDELRDKVFCWLNQRKPQQFRTTDYISKYCYCICTNALELTTNGRLQGYITLNFEATTPYWLVDKIEILDFTHKSVKEIDAHFNVQHPKYNDFVYFPSMTIDMNNNTSFILTNNSDVGRTFGFTGLLQNEVLTINPQIKQIVSSTNNIRIGKMINRNWFRLTKGTNILQCNSKIYIELQCSYPIYI